MGSETLKTLDIPVLMDSMLTERADRAEGLQAQP